MTERAKGMDGINSPVAKFLTAEIVEAILTAPARRMET